uniref:Uncharacterized protein LOC111133618 isoform X2 n=1 Tax=Crassostrea virginica TaxID=6565 RepID=A0A8B8EDW0_CRAVI|nr:uncharacterized protein LOC111133618 isoform X2 [Crassostrea virginica]
MVAMWSWILGELYYGVKGSFVSVYQQNPTLWNERWIQMKCCDVEKPTPFSIVCPFADRDGCFDVFANTITTYGSSYIAVLVVNILAEIVMIVGIEYLHRLQLMLDVTRTKPGRLIETKEIHNIRNGIVLATCVSLKATVKKNTSASLFGVMSMFSSAFDGSVALAIVFLKYNLYDITLTEEFYQITGAHNINMGYTGGALWITTICSFICSMIAKIMCFVGIFSERKWLFVMHIITEVITLIVECIMIVFAALIIKATICCFWKENAQCAEYTYPTTTVDPFSVCDYWTNSGSIFFSAFALVLILHIILKIILIVLSNEVFLKSKLGQLTEESNQNQKSVGIFTQASLAAKRFPMVATAILISTIICIVDCLYFCGLLIVRYGSSSYPFIEVEDVLSAIRLGPRTMTENRDNAIFIGLTSLSVSFFLQLGKFAAYYIKSSRVKLLILWLEILVIILQLASVSLVTTALKLVYCCFNSQDCVFSYESGLTVYSPIFYSFPYSVKTLLCDNEQKVWERVMLQSWLMFGFGMLCIFLQILSMIFGYKYFKKSTHRELGMTNCD